MTKAQKIGSMGTLTNVEKLWEIMWKEEYNHVLKMTVFGENFTPEERNSSLNALNKVDYNIDEILNELRHIYDTTFNLSLEKHSYQDIVKMLSDYKRENSPCVKKIIDKNSFYSVFIYNDGYQEYLEAVYNLNTNDGWYYSVNIKQGEPMPTFLMLKEWTIPARESLQ